jgi:hypothetical protein
MKPNYNQKLLNSDLSVLMQRTKKNIHAEMMFFLLMVK